MNFEFSPAQNQIKEEARRVLADRCSSKAVRAVIDQCTSFDRGLWATLGELGFQGIAVPEEYGGTGAGHLELCVIAEELGRANAPLPFSSSIYLAVELILTAGTAAQKRKYLPKLASGESIACLAWSEGKGNAVPKSIAVAVEAGLLTGSKSPVLDGDVADIAIVVARSASAGGGQGISLYVVDLHEPGVSRSTLMTIDPTRSQARIEFAGAVGDLLGAEGAGWDTLTAVLDRAAVLTAFEQLGGADRALEMARDYALERYAFGRPIASFQAIKHKLADMYVAIVLARSNCYFGAWALSQSSNELAEAAAAARVSATEAFQFCSKENIQVHGGVGCTWDFDCHLFYRRSNLLSLTLGGLTPWKDRLIDHMRQRRAIHGGAVHGL